MKLVEYSATKRSEYQNEKTDELEANSKNKHIRDLYIGISEFSKGYQPIGISDFYNGYQPRT
jgi:hypothetical protein